MSLSIAINVKPRLIYNYCGDNEAGLVQFINISLIWRVYFTQHIYFDLKYPQRP